MFDPDFIIDIICDFLINDPKPPFEIALELLHFLVERENFFKKSLGKLNKLVFILRNFLKGNNSSARLARLIQ